MKKREKLLGVSEKNNGMHMVWKQKTGTFRRERISKRGVGRTERTLNKKDE